MWGVQKTHNLTKEYTYRVRTLIWPFYFNLDLCGVKLCQKSNYRHNRYNQCKCTETVTYLYCKKCTVVIKQAWLLSFWVGIVFGLISKLPETLLTSIMSM